MDLMSRRDIFLHKKLKDQQVLQLHTRLHYLDQENKKKERQIEQRQRQAELAFENQIQSKHLNLQSRLQGCAEKIQKSIKVKAMHDETAQRKHSLYLSMRSKRKISARRVRKDKEQYEGLRSHIVTQDLLEQRFRAESQLKENQIKSHIRNNEAGRIDSQIQAMEVKKKRKLDDVNLLKTREQQIKHLAVAEKLLLDRLHSTIQHEDRVLNYLRQQRTKQNDIIQRVGTLDVEQFTRVLLSSNNSPKKSRARHKKYRSVALKSSDNTARLAAQGEGDGSAQNMDS